MQLLPWIGFLVFVFAMLAIDLGLLHRKATVIRFKEAIRFTAICAGLALAFCGMLWIAYDKNWLGLGVTIGEPLKGSEAALQFLTGWILEQSLSVDNVFVIALIFKSFKVPQIFQHRVLFWGILGALVFRGLMIAFGTAIIHRFAWVTYVFGAFLILTAIKMMLDKGDADVSPEHNLLVRLARKVWPVVPEFHGERFFVLVAGRYAMTPLFLALLVVESMDIVFAVDSIPAVIAITTDPFLVFTSNVFAILSLRSLFFAIVSVLDRFEHMTTSLIFVLAFVGTKMILAPHYKISTPISLAIIVGILAIGALASVRRRSR